MMPAKRGDKRRFNDPTRARAAKAAKREATRCLYSRACRGKRFGSSPFCWLHTSVALGDARSNMPADATGVYESARLTLSGDYEQLRAELEELHDDDEKEGSDER